MKIQFDAEMKRRLIMCVTGTVVMGMSVGLFSLAALGMDPFQVFCHGIWRLTPLSFGNCYTLISIVFLLITFLINRRKIGLGTVINLFLVGYIADFSEWLFGRLITGHGIVTRLLLLIVALFILCFSSSLYMVADLGVSAYDAQAITVSERSGIPFRTCRIVSDLLCVLLGSVFCILSDRDLSAEGALLVTVGAGTVITAFFMGPVISFFSKTVAEPMRKGSFGKR